MTKRKKRTAARMPEPGYQLPPSLSADGLVVTPRWKPDIPPKTYDFRKIRGVVAPPDLARSLVRAFDKATSPGGRWKAPASADSGAALVRRLLRDFSGMRVRTIEDVTVDIWNDWCARIRATNRVRGQIKLARCLLQDTIGLPAETSMALNARVTESRAPRLRSYSRPEARHIQLVALRRARATLRRLLDNEVARERYLSGTEPPETVRLEWQDGSWSAGKLVDQLSRACRLPDELSEWMYRVPARRRVVREMLGLDEHHAYWMAAFPDLAEMFNCMILLTGERAFNASASNNLSAAEHGRPVHRADGGISGKPLYVPAVNKRRRGAHAASSTVSLAGRQARVWRLIERVTQPCRDALEALGHPTDKLLVACAPHRSARRPTGMFITDFSKPSYASLRWHKFNTVVGDDGNPLKVKLQRLRRTRIVHSGVQRQQSQRVHDQYVMSDAQSREIARDVMEDVQSGLLPKAKQVLQMRAVSREKLTAARADPSALAGELGISRERAAQLVGGELNTSCAACLDIMDSPFAERAGEPCPATDMSCFGCRNAVATPEHLPQVVALDEALHSDFADAYDPDASVHRAQIGDLLLQKFRPEEVAQARAALTNDSIAAAEETLRGDRE